MALFSHSGKESETMFIWNTKVMHSIHNMLWVSRDWNQYMGIMLRESGYIDKKEYMFYYEGERRRG